MKLMDVITENRKYEYGCVMLYFDFPEIEKLHSQIKNEDIYHNPNDPSFGLETEPHTTLLFGLHPEVTDENVQKVLSNHQFGTCHISNSSFFDNPEYDVLKFDVSGDSLHECNSDLRKYPYTSNFPDYHPHMTIGYLNKGMGKKYTKLFENHQHTLIPQYAVYSKPDGSKTKFKINLK